MAVARATPACASLGAAARFLTNSSAQRWRNGADRKLKAFAQSLWSYYGTWGRVLGDGMASTQEPFRYEVEESQDASHYTTTTIRCHGRLMRQNAGQMKDLIRPLIARGDHVVVDFADLAYLDSSGLGALVGLKVYTIQNGLCRLELVNPSPRVRQLLTNTNLLELFSK